MLRDTRHESVRRQNRRRIAVASVLAAIASRHQHRGDRGPNKDSFQFGTPII
jgi:hypothetical protein